MNSNHYCVILAGGSGRNFWPVGRQALPLQFLDIAGMGESFLRATYNRLRKVYLNENIFVTTLSKYKNMVREQLPELPIENIVVEPYGRQTALCVAYANYCILKRNPNAIVTVSPSDLLIFNQEKFDKALQTVLEYSQTHDDLSIIGIAPDHPNTNYGYIQVRGNGNEGLLPVKTFTEKPNADLAEVFIKSGEFYWNSGIYTWKAAVIKEELETYAQEVTSLFRGWEASIGSPYETDFIEKVYMNSTNISIEYAVLEKTKRAVVFPADFGWADIGNWISLYDNFPGKDANGNAINSAHKLVQDNENCLIITKNTDKLVAIKGLKNYMVIDTEDALLICPKDSKSFTDFTSGISSTKYDKFK